MQRTSVVLLAVALAACSGKDKGNAAGAGDSAGKADSVAAATPPAGAMGAAAAPADVPNDPAMATVMRVTLTGGPSAGTYTAKSKERTCSVGGTQGDDVWANSYVDMNAESGLSVFNLTTAAIARKNGAGQTSDASFAVSIGNPMKGSKDYAIETKAAKKSGTATVAVSDDARSALLTIKGTTAQGVTVDAVVICNQVRRGR